MRSIEFKNTVQMISSHLLHFLDIHFSLDNGVILTLKLISCTVLFGILLMRFNQLKKKKVFLQSHFPLKRTLTLSTSPFVVDSSNNLWIMKHWVGSLLEYVCRASIRHGNTYLIFFAQDFIWRRLKSIHINFFQGCVFRLEVLKLYTESPMLLKTYFR